MSVVWRPPLPARAHRNVARLAACRSSRRAYGGDFVSTVDPRDDLLNYALEEFRDSRLSAYRAFGSYFNGGRANVEAIAAALLDAGITLAGAGSTLEFACGYGRLTRHLVPRMDRARLTVSDIDADAVAFVTSTFGVAGFSSTTDPADLLRRERYALILVISLFSHLPEATWRAWLRTLLSLLEPAGILLFTTLRLRGEAVLEEDREGFARGFLYKPHNETRGRLSVADYGTAVVSGDYVADAVREERAQLLAHHPLALGVQDAYVVQAQSAGSTNSR